MKKIEKYKEKYPIGSIIKHNCCNLMYEIIDYKFEKDHKNYYGVLSEEFVVFKTLYYPQEDIGKVQVFYIDHLREFKLSNLDYLSKIINERNLKQLKDKLVEKYEQLTLF